MNKRGKVEPVEPGPYGLNAVSYASRGWFPIPVKPNSKECAVVGYTGRDGKYPSTEQVDDWASDGYAGHNIAIRMAKDIIGIDVDAYDKKAGGETLSALEDELGKLPPTYVITSRDDGASGIRLFRVPGGKTWKGVAGPGIEILTWYHRYALTWPSIHPEGREYKWYHENVRHELSGAECPSYGDDFIPELPEAWDDFLRGERTGNGKTGRLTRAVVGAWLRELPAGRCDHMEDTIGKWLDRIVNAADDGGAHDAYRDGVKAVLGDAMAGHGGGRDGLFRLKDAFEDAVSARRQPEDLDGEIWRIVVGGVRLHYGRPIADSDPCSDLDPDKFKPKRRTSSVIPMSNVDSKNVSWLHFPMFPAGSVVIIDGDPSQGKSLLTLVMASAASNGEPMLPWGKSRLRGPVNVVLITTEDEPGVAMKPRLTEAGADLSRIFIEQPRVDRQGNRLILQLPNDGARIRRLIDDSGAAVCIIDPVMSFMGEMINTSNDASVRRALMPLISIAQETGCLIIIVRHLNKGSDGQKAMYRGGGSIAFSGVARSGLITGKLPDDLGGQYGLAHVFSNYSRPFKGTQEYSIESTTDDENGIPYIEWGDLHEDISADDLVNLSKPTHGPAAEVQDRIISVINPMFDEQPTWTVEDIKSALARAGIKNTNPATFKKAASRIGVQPRQVFRNGRAHHWVWSCDPEVLKLRLIRDGGR